MGIMGIYRGHPRGRDRSCPTVRPVSPLVTGRLSFSAQSSLIPINLTTTTTTTPGHCQGGHPTTSGIGPA